MSVPEAERKAVRIAECWAVLIYAQAVELPVAQLAVQSVESAADFGSEQVVVSEVVPPAAPQTVESEAAVVQQVETQAVFVAEHSAESADASEGLQHFEQQADFVAAKPVEP